MFAPLKKYFGTSVDVHLENGDLIAQQHPTLPLYIYNYSKTCQYSKNWSEVTLQTRGLILDENGNVVARPFSKFFNMEELGIKETEDRKNMPYKVYEKLDGSLGILFNYNGEWLFSSRGSFTSEQAIKGFELIKSNENLDLFNPNNTYCCEIIYPQNKIVVSYGDMAKCIFTAVIETATVKEFDVATIPSKNIVKMYSADEFNNIKSLDADNEEGRIVLFADGTRMKIKFENYFIKHRIKTDITTKSVWDGLKNDVDFEDMLSTIGDEDFKVVADYKKILETEFENIMATATAKFNSIYNENEDRKTFAQKASKEKNYAKLLFQMYDKNNINNIIWDMIQPKFERLG
jgi:RNA ligase